MGETDGWGAGSIRLSSFMAERRQIRGPSIGVEDQDVNTNQRMPEGVRVTMETFERMISADEGRRTELVGELSTLVKRQGELAATQDTSWIMEGFIEPRLTELRTVVNRLQMIRGRLTQLRNEWGTRPVALSCYEAVGQASTILCVTA
jgi:hypothetical protein